MPILLKLTIKNLRMNKARSIVTIIAIMVSAALITVITGMIGAMKETENDYNTKYYGDWDYCYAYTDKTKNDIDKLKEDRRISDIYWSRLVGSGVFKDDKNKEATQAAIFAASENYLSGMYRTTLEDGRYPKKENEIVYMNDFDLSAKVGDKIKIDQIEIGVNDRFDEGNISPDAVMQNAKTVEYTVVGILKSQYYIDNGPPTFYTYTDIDNCNTIYVNIKDEYEKDYADIISQHLGIDPEEITAQGEYTGSDEDGISLSMNTSVLVQKGILQTDSTQPGDYITPLLYIFIISMIIILSMFVIRSSIVISTNEKYKLYGMLSSIGATPRQIRRNVLFEVFILALIGIPLGIALGLGIEYLLVTIVNSVVTQISSDIVFIYSFPWLSIPISLGLGFALTLASSLGCAIEASKISPIEAIRNNTQTKQTKKEKNQNKVYKCPRIIKKMFGVGGEIAYKNVKRSRKKYRTTIIAIGISVGLFIGMTTFSVLFERSSAPMMDMGNYDLLAYTQSDSNHSRSEISSELKEYSSLDDAERLTVQQYIGIEVGADESQIAFIPPTYTSGGNYTYEEGKGYTYYLSLMCFSDDVYKDILEQIGADEEEMKDKGILYNKAIFTDSNGNTRRLTYSNYKEGDILNGVINVPSYYEEEYDPETGELISSNSVEADDDNKAQEIKDLTIGKVVDKLKVPGYFMHGGNLIVSRDYFEKLVAGDTIGVYYTLAVECDDSKNVEDIISSNGYPVINHEEETKRNQAILSLVNLFGYGLAAAITIIGITNVLNTLTTNMRLRRKEFAVMKSIGVTQKEFNKMISLESIFYSARSWLFGMLIGTVSIVVLNLLLSQMTAILTETEEGVSAPWVIPWSAILGSLLFVLVFVWVVMRISIRKTKNMNIIETIRNDNI